MLNKHILSRYSAKSCGSGICNFKNANAFSTKLAGPTLLTESVENSDMDNDFSFATLLSAGPTISTEAVEVSDVDNGVLFDVLCSLDPTKETFSVENSDYDEIWTS